MITINLSVLMHWFFVVLGGFIVYVVVGLIAVGCEVRWGFPFGIVSAISIVKETMGKNKVKFVIWGPLAFIFMAVCRLVAIVIEAVYMVGEIGNFFVNFFFNGFHFKETK